MNTDQILKLEEREKNILSKVDSGLNETQKLYRACGCSAFEARRIKERIAEKQEEDRNNRFNNAFNTSKIDRKFETIDFDTIIEKIITNPSLIDELKYMRENHKLSSASILVVKGNNKNNVNIVAQYLFYKLLDQYESGKITSVPAINIGFLYNDFEDRNDQSYILSTQHLLRIDEINPTTINTKCPAYDFILSTRRRKGFQTVLAFNDTKTRMEDATRVFGKELGELYQMSSTIDNKISFWGVKD